MYTIHLKMDARSENIRHSEIKAEAYSFSDCGKWCYYGSKGKLLSVVATSEIEKIKYSEIPEIDISSEVWQKAFQNNLKESLKDNELLIKQYKLDIDNSMLQKENRTLRIWCIALTGISIISTSAALFYRP